MKKMRYSNFELMRIISMLFIILGHILNDYHGNLIANCGNPVLKIFMEFLMFILIVHVNSFIVLTGYFQSKSKFRFSKVLKLILQVMFYILIPLIVAVKFKIVTDYTIVSFINSILPSVISNYWFICAYIVLYVFSDYINKLINSLSKEEYRNLLIVLFIMLSIVPYLSGYKILGNSGYNFYNFIFLYLIGAYLRLYPLKESYHFKNMSLNGYKSLMVIVFMMMASLNFLICFFAKEIDGTGALANEFFQRINISRLSYATPFIIIQTIAYFEFFNYIKFSSKIVNFISNSVIGVYLFHESPIIKRHIYKFLKIDDGIFFGYRKFLYAILMTAVIFVVGILIELIRKFIIYIVEKIPLIKFLIRKTKMFFESLNYRINW